MDPTFLTAKTEMAAGRGAKAWAVRQRPAMVCGCVVSDDEPDAGTIAGLLNDFRIHRRR